MNAFINCDNMHSFNTQRTKLMDFCRSALTVIELEGQAILNLANRIGPAFNEACKLMLNCKGRVVVTGMGKSGHIARKIAATLASTGTPAFFMHPGEANHGDLGMLTPNDVLLAISYSGQTQELVSWIPFAKRKQVPLISMSGNCESALAQAATVNLDVSIDQEACPLGLAPTTSTTVALVMGDALAIALLQARGFTREDFAMAHPGGSLGKRLLLRVNDLYHSEAALPIVLDVANIKDALLEVSTKKLGMTCVVDENNKLIGIYTDGDIRRTLANNYDITSTPLSKVMSPKPHTIHADALAAEALTIMQKNKISCLIVIDKLHSPIGVIHIHDLLEAGLI